MPGYTFISPPDIKWLELSCLVIEILVGLLCLLADSIHPIRLVIRLE